jgi:pSer/pThr/pTyr-binding forkhead associated (FHA) protein
MLAAEMSAYTSEEGLRLEGPVTVRIEPSTRATSGHVNCHVEVVPGPPVVWERLIANDESLEIGRNRATIGRAPDADVVVPHDDVSRRHALIYRERGQTWLRDLSSANGTFVDGSRIDGKPALVQNGSMVGLSEHRYRFREI